MKRGKTLSSVLGVVCVLLLGFTTFSALTLSQVKIVAYAADYGGEPTSPSGDNTSSSSSATATVHVNSACSLTSVVTTAHNAIMSNGTISNDVGSTKLTVKCNDGGGFAIYAIGYSNDEYGNTTMIGNTNSSLTIPTGTDTTLGNTTSHWAMKVAKDTTSYLPANLTIENSYDSYSVVPTDYTKIASYASSTDGASGTGSSVLATYSIRISNTQPADTYVGKIKYTMVHPNMVDNSNKPTAPIPSNVLTANYIIFAPNADDVEGDMSSLGTTTALTNASPRAGKITASANSTKDLIAPNFKRSGYGFAGWSTAYDATTATNPVIYGPNETISTNPQDDRGLDASGGAVLYPVWIAKETGVTMQTFNPANYTSAPNGTVIALEDERDHDVYAVAKLADGNWWMIENLRLDDSATLTTTNTHNPLHDTSNNDIVTLKTDYANNTIATHLAASNSGTWCNSNNAACDDQTMLNTNNTRLSDSSLAASYNASNATSKWYGYGNYYNWYSATAGNGTYGFGTNNDSVTGDLCPAGWRLPKGGQTTVNTTADYYALVKTLMDGAEPNQDNTNGYGNYIGIVDDVDLGATASRSLRAYPNNFVYSGSRNSTQSTGRNTFGSYWSSSVGGVQKAYDLELYRSSVEPGTNRDFKYIGFPVRCVANSPETWQFNNPIEISSLVGEEFSITFYSNNELFNSINFTTQGGKFSNCMNYGNMSCVFSDGIMGWGGQDVYNTITIVGGNDYNDSDFRTWLSNNATRL